jgi:dimeric dUTPase (all-alpha-NTP-PPase superfamily)
MKKDRLEQIFELQRKFNRSIGIDTDNMSDARQQQWLLNYCRALSQEVSELVDCCQWKWWARYQKFDKENAKVEVIDLLHFVVSAAQVLGMTADDFYKAYLKKNQINFERQIDGYIKK